MSACILSENQNTSFCKSIQRTPEILQQLPAKTCHLNNRTYIVIFKSFTWRLFTFGLRTQVIFCSEEIRNGSEDLSFGKYINLLHFYDTKKYPTQFYSFLRNSPASRRSSCRRGNNHITTVQKTCVCDNRKL